MRINDLAELMGKTRMEIEDILKSADVIELKLSERKARCHKDDDGFGIYE